MGMFQEGEWIVRTVVDGKEINSGIAEDEEQARGWLNGRAANAQADGWVLTRFTRYKACLRHGSHHKRLSIEKP